MANNTVDYRALSAELETIMLALQQDDLDVDVAMKNYERGLAVISQLETYLKTAETKITKLGATKD
jgi:exodeoxyribonuclease VII small subunit